MTMNKLSILFICFLPLMSLAQSPVSNRLNAGVDLGAGFAKEQVSPSFTYFQLLNVTRQKFFAVGWTATLRTNYASNVDYTTAPANLTRGGRANLDTLRMASASGTSLNFGVRAQIHIKFLEIGASADILGIALGKTRVGQYLSSTGKFVAGQTAAGADSLGRFTGANVSQSAKPTIANLQLLGDNSIGTLATEVYGRVLLGQRLGVKVGYQWLTTEYTTSVKNVVDGNNRFRNRAGLTYVALTFPMY